MYVVVYMSLPIQIVRRTPAGPRAPVGLAKVEATYRVAVQERVSDPACAAARRIVCEGCPSAAVVSGELSRCEECGCGFSSKLGDPSATCPLGKWENLDS